MAKAVRKIWNAVCAVLLTAFVLVVMALLGVRLVGLKPYAVLSGSMEPSYHVGSLIYVKAVDYRELAAGDAITYMLSQDTVVTHRIIEVLPDGEDPEVFRYYTKGDANENPDVASVHCRNIIGKPVFSIPYLGYVANYIQKPPGMYVAVASAALLVMLVFLPDIFTDEDKKKQK